LGIFEDEKNEPNKLYVFFINHRRTGSVVEVFEHILNTKVLTHLNTVKHDLILTPNNLVPVSKDEFYITNDHYYKDGKIMRMIEGTFIHLFILFFYLFFFFLYSFILFIYFLYLLYLALGRLPWTNVVYHSLATNTTEIVAEGLRYANGINTNWDQSKIYVAESFGGEVLIYDRKSNNKLHLSDRVFVEVLLDNLSVDDKGEIYVAGMYMHLKFIIIINHSLLLLYIYYLYLLFFGIGSQKAIDAMKFLSDPSDPSLSFPLVVVKISNNTDEDKFYGKKYSHKIVFEDNGSFMSAVTVAAVRGKVLLLGSLCTEGLGRCDELI
jgi:arylesterase / paraoxonase